MDEGNKIRKTSFGSLEHLVESDGKLVAELATFSSKGRNHVHDTYEHCYVLSGTGIIVSGQERYSVGPREVVSIPPKTGHWMIPDEGAELRILLVYSENALIG